MSLRPYIKNLKEKNLIVDIAESVNPNLEITEVLKKFHQKTVFFHKIKNAKFPLVGNLLPQRDYLKKLLFPEKNHYTFFLKASENPVKPNKSASSCTFNNESSIDLFNLPIPQFFSTDGGKYLTSGIVIARNPHTNKMNASIHRIMISCKKRGVIRLVPRDLYRIYHYNKKQGKDTPVAIVIGYHPFLALAASTPQPYGYSEFDIANQLLNEKLELIKSPLFNIDVPANVEFVLEGRILSNEEKEEGPFVDITGTKDSIRIQPVIEFERIYHRDEPIFQTVLPAYEEHFLLMGFPKELQIYSAVKKVVPSVHEVHLTTGGSGWLHVVISITPLKKGDSKNVGLAAFAAHPSLKWCTIVSEDIDVKNTNAVEWATITRVGKGDIIVIDGVRGSSLDPSRDRTDDTTIKVIIDATKKEDKNETEYKRIIPF